MDAAAASDRVKDREWVFPVCIGTVAFWLGKKVSDTASDLHSHKWTVYVRGVDNEDITHVVKTVTFHLHSSFNQPQRVVSAPPFELTETGWGEFEIGVTLAFQPDVGEPPVDLYHRLRLFSDEEGWVQTPKKPVVVEQYEELVFWEPRNAFLARVHAHKPRKAIETELTQWFPTIEEEAEIARLEEAKRKVLEQVEQLQSQLDSATHAGAH